MEQTRSLNHQYFGAIDGWFYRYLAGVRRPAEPGFEHVESSPLPVSDLDWAAGSIETVRGTVAVRWERMKTAGESRTQDGLHLKAEIPSNTTASVRVPTLGGEKVRVHWNGRVVWNNGHATGDVDEENITRNDDAIVVEADSGSHEFKLEQLGKARK